MADYWKSNDKKYCDICKCWLTDNKASIAFHENGNRHKINVEKKIRDIHKKNRTDLKAERKMGNEMRKIEQAALEASRKDMEANPDVTMKIQSYYNMMKEKGEDLPGQEEPGPSKPKEPTILHRSDKQKKADESVIANLNKPQKSYNRLAGWEAPKSNAIGKDYLELPSKRTKSPGTALHLASKIEEETPITFGEKRVASGEGESGVKIEGGAVLFKKRKLNKGGMRRRDEEDN